MQSTSLQTAEVSKAFLLLPPKDFQDIFVCVNNTFCQILNDLVSNRKSLQTAEAAKVPFLSKLTSRWEGFGGLAFLVASWPTAKEVTAENDDCTT